MAEVGTSGMIGPPPQTCQCRAQRCFDTFTQEGHEGRRLEGSEVTKPFRFGVNIRAAESGADWATKARKLEALGYSMLGVPDHLADMIAPMTALAVAAAVTARLRVGTMVLNNDLRHPVVVAREAATLDLLSGGRFELGLGAGHMKSEYDQAGLSFDAGATRVERLAVVVIKRLLSGEEVTFAGRHYQVTGHRIYPSPVQRPHPPILIGGNGRRLLTLAAQHADIVALTGITFRSGGTQPDVSAFRAAAVDERLRLIQDVAGARWDGLELNALVQRVIVTDDRRHAAEELAGRWPSLGADDLLESPHVLLGTVDQLVEDLKMRRERWSISYYSIFEPFVDAFAPVVARLAGR
jgi:probable F420-dependent oxidoreductase